ncbi:hypothetical protein Sjap_013967 [Stephania japonica]|uniref:D-aminoacid aminotransferase-like PLP-dependent enzymes superfamily protein n=1 Tax=Stephania japonica TaxID=461633 RepID=A0AAP0J061_9MAGN
MSSSPKVLPTKNMSICKFLVVNGVVSQSVEVPPVSSLLETHPGAYTTSRTHSNASYLLFWESHLQRLADSTRILAERRPDLLFGLGDKRVLPKSHFASFSLWESVILPRVDESLRNVLPIALEGRSSGKELAITTLVSGDSRNLGGLDGGGGEREQDWVFRALNVYVHIGFYVPPVFGDELNCGRLAIVGRGREIARAKFAEWVWQRKKFDGLKPPMVNEILLTNDGDRILEGGVTNFFVVSRMDDSSSNREKGFTYEVQTASINEGVLPGIVRQLIIEVCLAMGIPVREVAPSWSKRELWEEAFTTNGLRLVQHVESIQAPSSLELKKGLKFWSTCYIAIASFEDQPPTRTCILKIIVMTRKCQSMKLDQIRSAFCKLD